MVGKQMENSKVSRMATGYLKI